jgi:hypothetical protein
MSILIMQQLWNLEWQPGPTMSVTILAIFFLQPQLALKFERRFLMLRARTCRRPSLLRNRGRTIECNENNAYCIPPLGCFSRQYRGESFLFIRNRDSTSQLCLTETRNIFDVLCIRGVHCEGNFDCYRSCTG